LSINLESNINGIVSLRFIRYCRKLAI
jgi:hypothetical protein